MCRLEKLIKRVKTLESQRNSLIKKINLKGGIMSSEDKKIYDALSRQLNAIASLDDLIENLERKKNPDEIPW